MAPSWDPEHYLRYADERSRPFFDLTARIAAEEPTVVVDLGCGPGTLTQSLADRWPGARVTGVDSSAEMIARARAAGGTVTYLHQDLREWQPGVPVDVLVSNATLQWVPDYPSELPRLVEAVRPGGWFAFQVPVNHGEPVHRLLRETAARPPFRDHTAGLERDVDVPAIDVVRILTGVGCDVDVWTTTYLHVLPGEDPVLDWISGTGARPVLQALPEDLRTQFVEQYGALLREAYPREDFGTVLPFPRRFAVARRRP